MAQLFHADSRVGVLLLQRLSTERGPPLFANILLSALLVVGVVGVVMLAMRQRFMHHLDKLEAGLKKPGRAQALRSDLPAEVLARAARMGARADGACGYAVFEQSGQMWKTPGGKPSDFTARQTARVDAPGFLWRASMGPITVVDYFVNGIGGLEVLTQAISLQVLELNRVDRIGRGRVQSKGPGLSLSSDGMLLR